MADICKTPKSLNGIGHKKGNNKKHKYGLDYIILFLTGLCLVFLMNFADAKLNEVIESDREALLIKHDDDNPIHAQLAEEIIKFRPDSCKMIEVYSETYDQILTVQFKEGEGNFDSIITDHKELVNLFENNEEGHTEVNINDDIEDVYFRWTTTTTGEKCLFIIYMSRPIVENLWVFKAICIFIMLLVAILIIRIAMHDHDQALESYEKTTVSVQDSIFLK